MGGTSNLSDSILPYFAQKAHSYFIYFVKICNGLQFSTPFY